tara:strand:+ start:817 stop:2091 length:1275 start_codon:yes stop_codon:yes gene_type:complete
MRTCLGKIKQFCSYKYATYYFKFGVFSLLSAPAISVIFLISSVAIGLKKRQKSIFDEKINLYLIISAILMIISCIYKSFPINFPYDSWSPSLSWYGLANWIPLFIFFLGFQSFLDSKEKRRQVSLLFIFGSIPLLVSGILQYFFKIYGPFETLNGLIIWFSRPLNNGEGLTGLFNNPNYAGAWLSLVFPFSLAFCLEKKRKSKKLISSLICLLIVFVSLFTFSRSSWLNIGLSSILILGKSSIFFVIPICIIAIYLLAECFNGFNQEINNNLIKNAFVENFCLKFKEIGFSNSHRLIIWRNAFSLIKLNWILGYGASSFSTLYFLRSGRFTTHSHNILIDVAFNYGIFASALLGIFVFNLIFKSFRKIYLNKNTKQKVNNFDKAWWASIFVIALSHLYDNQYYDLRISISSWILLAGIKNILSE